MNLTEKPSHTRRKSVHVSPLKANFYLRLEPQISLDDLSTRLDSISKAILDMKKPDKIPPTFEALSTLDSDDFVSKARYCNLHDRFVTALYAHKEACTFLSEVKDLADYLFERAQIAENKVAATEAM